MRRNTRAEQERQTRVSDLQNDIVLWLNERQAAEQKPDLDRSAILHTIYVVSCTVKRCGIHSTIFYVYTLYADR